MNFLKRLPAVGEFCQNRIDGARCVRVVVASTGRRDSPWGYPQGEKSRAEGVNWMRYYSAEFKNNLVKKMTVPPARSASSLCREEGIAQSTLSRWLREAVIIGLKGEGMG